MPYPPEPWHLHGHAHVGVFLLPRGETPPPHSPRTRALTVFGRTIVAAAFFRYTDPSPLTYDEIMATQFVRDGWRPRVSITHIWVDSPDSMAGGRELWAIPKDLAEFDVTPGVSYIARGIGSLTLRPRRWRLPLPLGFRVAQDRDGVLVTTPVRGSGRFSIAARARWVFDPAGALGFLAGRRAVVTLTVHPFRLRFGSGR